VFSALYLAISAGCRGFISINDWLHSYQEELFALFCPAKNQLPSYSTIRRVLLRLDYKAYSLCLAKFFEIAPLRGETIAIDGRVLGGSYNVDTVSSTTESHPAIQLVTVYPVRSGEIRRSYTPYAEGDNAAIVMEFISATEGTEYSIDPHYPYGKWHFYEQILKVPIYVIFHPKNAALGVYRLVDGEYQIMESDKIQNEIKLFWIESIGLFLGVWQKS